MMTMTFRQGIHKNRKEQYLAVKNDGVYVLCENEPLIVNFANGANDYIHLESVTKLCWRIPKNTTSTTWLYWDMNIYTGQITYGTTKVNPFSVKGYGITYPKNPIVDQHFFNIKEMKMKKWSGKSWNDCIRVFAGYTKANNIYAFDFGSQVGVLDRRDVGILIKDSNAEAIKVESALGDGAFVTSASLILIENQPYKIGAKRVFKKAQEPIPKFCGVSIEKNGKLCVATSKTVNKCIGVSAIDLPKEVFGSVIQQGHINSIDWNWEAPVGTPLYLTREGYLTLEIPSDGYIQEIAIITGIQSIFVNPKERIIIY